MLTVGLFDVMQARGQRLGQRTEHVHITTTSIGGHQLVLIFCIRTIRIVFSQVWRKSQVDLPQVSLPSSRRAPILNSAPVWARSASIRNAHVIISSHYPRSNRRGNEDLCVIYSRDHGLLVLLLGSFGLLALHRACTK